MDRIAVLLAKARSSGLSSDEKDELASLVDAPILDPLDSSDSGYESKFDFVSSDVPRRIGEIDWFSRCGEAPSLNLTAHIRPVTSLSEAVKCCIDGTWENATLEARNQLTLWLHQHDRESYQKWNELVHGFKASVLDPLKNGRWEARLRPRGLDSRVIPAIEWDVLGALTENAYLGSGHRSFFFLELLTVYEAGHFPCGWIGNWPKGELIVY